MLSSFRSALATGTASKRILLLAGGFFLLSLLVDLLTIDVLIHPGRPGTTLSRRSMEAYAWTGTESLLFGVLIHYLEKKTDLLSFEASE